MALPRMFFFQFIYLINTRHTFFIYWITDLLDENPVGGAGIKIKLGKICLMAFFFFRKATKMG